MNNISLFQGKGKMTTYWLLRERKSSTSSGPSAPLTKMNAQVSHMRLDSKSKIPPSPILSQRKNLANNGKVNTKRAESPSDEGIPLLAVTTALDPNNA